MSDRTERAELTVMVMVNKKGTDLVAVQERRKGSWDGLIFPGGHLERGESFACAAVREVKEETGLDLAEIIRVLPPAYSAVGLSNEQCICVFGVAEGEIAPCRETGEEITARWYSRRELREMLKSCTFGSWAQAYSYMWTEGF